MKCQSDQRTGFQFSRKLVHTWLAAAALDDTGLDGWWYLGQVGTIQVLIQGFLVHEWDLCPLEIICQNPKGIQWHVHSEATSREKLHADAALLKGCVVLCPGGLGLKQASRTGKDSSTSEGTECSRDTSQLILCGTGIGHRYQGTNRRVRQDVGVTSPWEAEGGIATKQGRYWCLPRARPCSRSQRQHRTE